MGHVEQYVRARAYCSANSPFAQSAQFWGHVRARVLVCKSSQARYSAWDSDANLTGNRLQD